jgi:hypothetical protein
VQTGIHTWPWCMGVFGARFAVFVRRARVLPGPCPATRNLWFLKCHRHRQNCVPVFFFDLIDGIDLFVRPIGFGLVIVRFNLMI